MRPLSNWVLSLISWRFISSSNFSFICCEYLNGTNRPVILWCSTSSYINLLFILISRLGTRSELQFPSFLFYYVNEKYLYVGLNAHVCFALFSSSHFVNFFLWWISVCYCSGPIWSCRFWIHVQLKFCRLYIKNIRFAPTRLIMFSYYLYSLRCGVVELMTLRRPLLEDQKDFYGMCYFCPSFPINQPLPLGACIYFLGWARGHQLVEWAYPSNLSLLDQSG